MTRSDYEERRENRIERFKELAGKNAELSDHLCKTSSDLLSVIPMGQPILVGHHSERGHRRLLERTDNLMRKSCEAQDKAEYYARRAKGAESNNAISSDNPDAIEALKAKLQNLKDSHALMIAGNKIIKSKKLTDDQKNAELVKIGLSPEKLKPDIMGNIGFAGYAITNSGANIRNVEKRIAQLEKESTEITTEQMIGDISIINSIEENRILIMFPGIPDESIRARLKSDGFRWSPTNRAWQAFRSASWKIPGIIKYLSVMPCYINPSMIPAEV